MDKTLLIIEDDISSQLILAHYLKKEYNIVAKRDSLEAMEWLEAENQADLIIADLNLPHFNGFEIIQALRASYVFKNVPILILSGLESSVDKIRCLEMGADDYVLKPFNPAEVKARVRTILRRSTVVASHR